MNFTQPRNNAVQVTNHSTKILSPWLRRLGIACIITSVTLTVLCLVEVLDASPFLFPITLLSMCAIFHTVLGVFSVYGGGDVIQYRGFVVASVVLGLIGPSLLICVMIFTDLLPWLLSGHFSYLVSRTLRAIVVFCFCQLVIAGAISGVASFNLHHHRSDYANRFDLRHHRSDYANSFNLRHHRSDYANSFNLRHHRSDYANSSVTTNIPHVTVPPAYNDAPPPYETLMVYYQRNNLVENPATININQLPIRNPIATSHTNP